MKKQLRKIICVMAILTLMLSTAATAYADSSVTYKGQAEKFVFAPGSDYSLTDLFTNYKGVMPGDSLTQKITIRNEASNKVNIEIFMRALGATDLEKGVDGVASVSEAVSDEFLDELHLIVVQDGDSVLFDAPANETAQLSDWVSLGTFYSGAEVNLDVTLTVPIEMGNEFQDRLIGALDWQFKVVETPVPEPTEPDVSDDETQPTQPTDTQDEEQPGHSETQTGDSFNLLVPAAVMAAALAAILIALLAKRRKTEQ